MKRILLFILALGFGLQASAQLDRSQRPKPGPASEIRLADPATFTLANGLKVFVVQNNKLPRLSVSLVLDVDPVMQGDAVGYVDIVGELIRTGTKSKSKAEIDAIIDQIGASVSTSATGLYAASLSKHKTKLFDILSELVLETEFRQDELDRIKKQFTSNLQTEKDDANAIAGKVGNVLVFGKNHPYGQITTEKTIEKASLDLCRKHFDTYFKPNVGYLALVGDITVNEARNLVEKAFGSWKSAEVPRHQYAMPEPPAQTRVIVVDRPVAVQTVINISHPVDLKPGSDDAIKASVMNTILGGGDARLFNNLRETYGFTYGAYSSLTKNNLVGEFNANAQVRSAVTDSSVMMFLYELNRIRDTIANVSEVDGILKYLNGTFAIGLQNPQTIATFAIEIERYKLSKDYYRNYLKNLAAITPADVQRTAQKYVLPANSYIICVGNKAAIAAGLEKYAASGKVEFYDMFGNEVKEAAAPLPAGLTAEKVIENYITAVGGRKNWDKVKNIDMTMGATVQNMTLIMQMKKMQPGMLINHITLNGAMTMQKIVFDGTKGKASGMQGSENLEGEKLEEIRESAAMLPEANYLDGKTTLTLVGIEKLNEQPTYVLAVVSPSGKKVTEYYDVATGLKVREVTTVDGPQGEASQISDLSDYRSIKPGILIPHTTTLDMGAQLIKLEMKSVTVNGKMKKTDFAVE